MRPDLLLLLLRPAGAYELSGRDWSWQSHPIEDPFRIDADSFPPEEVDPDDLVAAVDSAMQHWMDAGYDVQLARGEPVEGAEQSPDGSFALFHGEVPDMGGALAYTAVWSYSSGEIFDCDLVFLDWDDEGEIVWSADPIGPVEGAFDVESVALHELGHCLGLAHSEDTSAIMYAKYTGARALAQDDLDGLAAMYGVACVDADGDGVSACDGDCDDGSALVSPARAEVCDGLDDNCNGAIDELEDELATLGGDSSNADWSEESVGNGFVVDSATTLRGVRQRWEGPEGARLVWSVSRSEDDGESWTLVRSARGEAVAGEWQESPALDLPLEAGFVYAVVLGSVSDGVTMYYQKRPDLDPQGPLTPLGSLYGRAIGDQLGEPDSRYLVYQELSLTAVEDPDAICGADSGAPLDTDPAEVQGEPAEKRGGCAAATGLPLALLALRLRRRA